MSHYQDNVCMYTYDNDDNDNAREIYFYFICICIYIYIFEYILMDNIKLLHILYHKKSNRSLHDTILD